MLARQLRAVEIAFSGKEYQLGANCFCARPSLLAVHRRRMYAPVFL